MSNFRGLPFPFKRFSSKSVVAGIFTVFLFFSNIVFNPQAHSQQRDEDEVVRVESDLVILNVTVTDRQGRYIHKTGTHRLQVLEDGREQDINFFSVRDSVRGGHSPRYVREHGGPVSLARAAAIRFLDGLRADDVAAVYNFDSLVEQLQDYSPGRDLPPLAYGLNSRGMTALNDAVLRAARDLSARPEKRRAIIVLSDGADTKSVPRLQTKHYQPHWRRTRPSTL